MLSFFSKLKSSRERKRAEILINNGLENIKGSFQHKALYQFQQALEINPDAVRELLSVEFDKSYRAGDHELAIEIGLIVLKIKKDDHELANKLGNCARKLKNYKQANDLYRQAFRINRSNRVPLYNLAASMGHIPLYNNDVKILVDQFKGVKEYVLPNYKLDLDYLDHINDEIRKEKGIEEEEEEEENRFHATYGQLCEVIGRKIKESGKKTKDKKGKQKLEGHIFNLGLLALSKKDSKRALKCFFQLKNRKSRLEYLDMCITLAMDLESPSKKVVQHMMILLGNDKTNRYLNANLGLMFRKQGKHILSYKYFATAALHLEKSNGIYCRKDLIRLADQEMEVGNLKKAFSLYKLVDSEIESALVKYSMGEIFLYQNRYLEALPIFKEILELDEKYKPAYEKLNEIHDYFVGKGDEMFNAEEYTKSLTYFERALSAVRLPETVKKTADVYKQLMNVDKAEELYVEFNKIIRNNAKENKELLRQSYINSGKEFLAKQELDAAINNFEKAFEMKVDKDVFVFLAHIYKKLKRTDKLKDIMNRWKVQIKSEGISLNDI